MAAQRTGRFFRQSAKVNMISDTAELTMSSQLCPLTCVSKRKTVCTRLTFIKMSKRGTQICSMRLELYILLDVFKANWGVSWYWVCFFEDF